MKITNPRDVDFTIQVKGGQTYTVLANDSITGVPSEHANFWKELHPFMMVTEDAGVKKVKEETNVEIKEEVVEALEKVIEEVVPEIEEVKEETIVDKVKKATRKVTSNKK